MLLKRLDELSEEKKKNETQSHSTFGKEKLKALKSAGAIRCPLPQSPLSPAPPLMDQTMLTHLSSVTSEKELVQLVTPILANLFRQASPKRYDDGPFSVELCNSESLRWIDFAKKPVDSENWLKCDLFEGYACFVKPKREGAGRGQGEGEGYLYGTGFREMQPLLAYRRVVEAKLGNNSLTNSDQGELFEYLTQFPGWVLGVLFNTKQVYLVEAHGGSLVMQTQLEWGARGSMDEFLAVCRKVDTQAGEPPVMRLLKGVCGELGVAPAGRGSYLGGGLLGRVLSVVKTGARDGPPRAKANGRQCKPMALKIVLECLYKTEARALPH